MLITFSCNMLREESHSSVPVPTSVLESIHAHKGRFQNLLENSVGVAKCAVSSGVSTVNAP